MLHENQFQDKGHGVRYAHTKGIADTVLLRIAEQYKTGVSRKIKTLLARNLAQTVQGTPKVITSIKYDGEGVFIYYLEGHPLVAFNAPSGRARIGLPCLVELEAELKAKGVKKLLAPAEFYLKTNPTEQKCKVGDVISVMANGSPEQRENLALAVYDLIMLDGKDLRNEQKTFGKNWDTLATLVGTDTNKKFHRAEGEAMPGEAVEAYFKKLTEELGHEGCVIRYPETDTTFKVKPNLTVDCVVIGYVEGEFEGQYGVLSLLCGLCGPDGKTIQAFARVGSGFKDNLRASLLEVLSPIKVDSPIRMSDSDGRPISFVQPKLVVEIEGEALVEKNLQDKPSSSQTFEWSKDSSSYGFKGINACPRLSHAVLHRLREDKTWDDGGTRMEQVLGPKTIADLLAPPQEKSAEATIALREVYTKSDKSGAVNAIRKIVVIERNDALFHPYTIHWTDFGTGRKDPFKNEIAVADTKERMETLVAIYREEANKRGWAKLEAPSASGNPEPVETAN
jgi:hypothetical protein